MIEQKYPILTDLSHELLCHILQFLPLQEILSISMLCKKLLDAVSMHLGLCKSIDFCEGKIYGYMPSSITDDHMHSLFDKCPKLETVYGLHPLKVERRRLRKRAALTVPGIIEALNLCHNLKAVETSDLRLLEAILQHLPQLKIIGHFQNRDGVFPPQASQRLKLVPYPRISSLHLIGVEVPELTAMPHLEHLHLQYVRFTKLQPFRGFLATKLKTFVMKHCMGPSLSLRYLSLIIALSSSPDLTRLELVRVPLPGGLFQRAVEDSYRHSGFVNLKVLVISGCKGVLESDLGHLMIVASRNLERVFIQPSLTRDSLFVSLSFAHCQFPKLKDIHLGYVDKFEFSGSWSNDSLVSLGLAEIPDTPSSLTDSGMKVISQLFPLVQSMSVSNCPHLMLMEQWSARDNGEMQGWKELTELTLQRCHCLQLASFAAFLGSIPKIEVVILNDMFREPPKGCSHVGLSAGTGLGMSSAVVSNQDEHIAVQGHQQDFELHADDHLENDEMDRDFMDVDNVDNPDQHIMVLQQEFFDEENHVAPAAVMQRENVDPENRIENMEQDVPENRIRRELNEDYEGEMNENSSEIIKPPKYLHLLKEYEPSSSDEDDYSKTSNSANESAPLKISKSVGTTSCFGTIDSACRKGCCESQILPSFQRNLSPALSDENLNFDPHDENVSNSLSESNKQASLDKNSNFCVKKCIHSKICTNKCSKGFDPNQPSTSRGGNCLDCACVDSVSEKKATGIKSVSGKKVTGIESVSERKVTENKSVAEKNVQEINSVSEKEVAEIKSVSENKVAEIKPVSEEKVAEINSAAEEKVAEIKIKEEILSDESCDNHQPSHPVPNFVSTKRKRPVREDDLSDDKIFEGPLTRGRKKVLCQNVKKESAFSGSCNEKKVNTGELSNAQEDEWSDAQRDELSGAQLDDFSDAHSDKWSNTRRNEPSHREDILNNGYPLLTRYDITRAYVASLPVPIKTEPPNDGYGRKEITLIRDTRSFEKGNPNMHIKKEKEENVDQLCDKQKAKKHKKHKHKKRRKSSKSCRQSRRRGPITRSRSSKYLQDGDDLINQGTQATSADIRRSLRKQRSCSLRCKKRGTGSSCSSSHRRSHNHISGKQQLKKSSRTQTNKPKVEVQNKATSTSDPLMEDDAIQILRLVSETLISLTVISCGISDIFIDHCQSLTHIEVQACRILKMFQLTHCPLLKRFNISQCPKLTLEVIVPEVLSLHTTKKLLVSFEPCMQAYYPSNSERLIYSKAPTDQSIILFHDFTNPINESVQASAKENIMRWMEIVHRRYFSSKISYFLKLIEFRQNHNRKKINKVKFRESKSRYPYGHFLKRIHGMFPITSSDPDSRKDGRYQILTNDHVFISALEKLPWDSGFPCPDSPGDFSGDRGLKSIVETEFTETRLRMKKKLTSFYIPVSDSS